MARGLLNKVKSCAGVVTEITPCFGRVIQARRSFKGTIEGIYHFRKDSLKNEISLLERETPGRSIYSSHEYMGLVLRRHGDTCKEAIKADIPEEHVKFIGDTFMKEYNKVAEMFVSLVKKYHPQMELEFS